MATLMVVSVSGAARARLGALFGDAGFMVVEAPDLSTARRLLTTARLDLIVLECPTLIEGELAFCRTVAARSGLPLLILAAAADVVDEIVALELGADDLISGVAADRLVLARAKALLRRTRPSIESPIEPPRDAGWRLNLTTRMAVSPNGQSTLLSPADASAFHLFLCNPGVVFTCEAGARALGARLPDARGFRTTVCRLRKKLNPLDGHEPIQTVRGAGYVYAPRAAGRPVDGVAVTRDAAAAPGAASAGDAGHPALAA